MRQFYHSLTVGDKMALIVPVLSILVWWMLVGRKKGLTR